MKSKFGQKIRLRRCKAAADMNIQEILSSDLELDMVEEIDALFRVFNESLGLCECGKWKGLDGLDKCCCD